MLYWHKKQQCNVHITVVGPCSCDDIMTTWILISSIMICTTSAPWLGHWTSHSDMASLRLMGKDRRGLGCDAHCKHLWLWQACLKRCVKVIWFRLQRLETVRHTTSKTNVREMSLYRYCIGPDCRQSASIYGKTRCLPQAFSFCFLFVSIKGMYCYLNVIYIFYFHFWFLILNCDQGCNYPVFSSDVALHG